MVESKSFKNEEHLQELVKNNPELLNLKSVFDSSLLIVGRENKRIDILGLTEDGTPVIIECKKKDNADMRYLLAQLFDYATVLSKLTYKELDEIAINYFKSDRCKDSRYRDCNNLEEAYNIFIESAGELDFEGDSGSNSFEEFKKDVTKNLSEGKFYLVAVVDKILPTVLETVRFFNSKIQDLRIDIVEIRKFAGTDGIEIYVPYHVNKEKVGKERKPGSIRFEEMLDNTSSNNATIVKEFKKVWDAIGETTIQMGKKGFSAWYKDKSVFWVFPNRLHLHTKDEQHRVTDKQLEFK